MMKFKNIILISIVFIIAIVILGNLLFHTDSAEDIIEVREEELNKNKGLTLLPGEKYSYLISGEQTGIIEFKVKLGIDCMGIHIFDDYSGVCIKSDGTDEYQSNMTLAHPQVTFFKPWMLALEQDWDWKVEYFDKHSGKKILEYEFKVVGEEEIYGRDSYVVELSGPGETVFIEWIDKEKRVLLKETGGLYEMEIVEAPFELKK